LSANPLVLLFNMHTCLWKHLPDARSSTGNLTRTVAVTDHKWWLYSACLSS